MKNNYKKICILILIILFFPNCRKSKKDALWPLLLMGGSSSAQTSDTATASTETPEITPTPIETVSAPTFSPTTGHYTSPQSITISTSTVGATIYYTIDGSTPTTSSSIYTISISDTRSLAGKTIKAFAVKSGLTDSSVVNGVYSYPLVKTGQTLCYDNSHNPVTCSSTYKGQDAQESKGLTRSYTGPTQHSTHTSDYTTTDNATGLVWRSCSQGQSGETCNGTAVSNLTKDTAQSDSTNGCSALNSANSGSGYAGRTNWRLPTVLELASLIDSSKDYTLSMNLTAFPNTPGTYQGFDSIFYSSTP